MGNINDTLKNSKNNLTRQNGANQRVINLFGEECASPLAKTNNSEGEKKWPTGTIFVQVVLAVPLNQNFTYLNPENSLAPNVGSWIMVPFGGGKSNGGRIMPALVVKHSTSPPFGIKRFRTWKSLVPIDLMPNDWMQLLTFAANFYHYPLGLTAAAVFPLALRSYSNKKAHPATKEKTVEWFSFQEKSAIIRATPSFIRRKNWHRLLTIVENNPLINLPMFKKSTPNLTSAFKDWCELGWIIPATSSAIPSSNKLAKLHELTNEQKKVVDNILPNNATVSFSAHLLQGITGSGKTEVYFSLAEKTLQAGKQVLLLMPEIALTPQMNERLTRRFPNEPVATLHSSLSAGARLKALMAAMRGEVKLVVGTRLAVFAPLKNLGLIIVDEEHDASFKQSEQAFSYSARDLAIYRAKQWACPIILGSATPSFESYHHAMQGHYQLHELTERAVSGAKLPTIECVDIKGQKLINGFAPLSLSVIDATLNAGEQVLVFLNRRGYAPALFCDACGWIAGCTSCSANLVLHQADSCLRCHHCGYQEAIPQGCTFCGNADILMKGFGTQKLEEVLRERFPKVSIQRIDRDISRGFQTFSKQQRAISEGRVQLIIGTQMMAKGHDFPDLTTVVVLGSDGVLFSSDYRGAERMFSLLTQVAGRAGRHQKAGRVLIQTAFSEHTLFAPLIAHDYPNFAQQQLLERQLQTVPPFIFQALLRVESSSLKIASEWLKSHSAIFSTYATSSVLLYDAIPMRLARKAGWERMQMLIECQNRSLLHAFLKSMTGYLYTLRARQDLKWWLDVSPLEI